MLFYIRFCRLWICLWLWSLDWRERELDILSPSAWQDKESWSVLCCTRRSLELFTSCLDSVRQNVSNISIEAGSSFHDKKAYFSASFLLDVSSGNVQAISLQDICLRALGKLPKTRAVRRKDESWENLKKTNLTSFIRIYRYVHIYWLKLCKNKIN